MCITLNPWLRTSFKIQTARKCNCFPAPSAPHSGCSNLPVSSEPSACLFFPPPPHPALSTGDLHRENKSHRLSATKPSYLPVPPPNLISFPPIGMAYETPPPSEVKPSPTTQMAYPTDSPPFCPYLLPLGFSN